MKSVKNTKFEKLTAEQMAELRSHEAAIRKGTSSFVEMCEAFSEIDRLDLWKGSHKSFPSYCREKWCFEPHEVSRFIKAAEVIEDLKGITDILPSNGGQCRVLGRLETEQRKAIWKLVLDSKAKPTSGLIEKKAREAGYIKANETDKQPAPPKEGPTFVSNLIMVAQSIECFAEGVPELDEEEIRKVKEFVMVARANLDQLEAAVHRLAA